jgi:NAD(P)-dependent dehydrogenase (short-subunit alcohol dehydrogenase family)
VLAVEGDLAEPATADRIVDGALERFGRIDTLVNNAGVYISKPFTDYTAADYALITGH